MRSGTIESIDELLDTIREDRMGSSTIHCIWQNVMALQKLSDGDTNNVSMSKSSSDKPTNPEISSLKFPPESRDVRRSNDRTLIPHTSTQASPTPLVKSNVWGETKDLDIKSSACPCPEPEVHSTLSVPTPISGSKSVHKGPDDLPAESRRRTSPTRAASEPVRKLHTLDSFLSLWGRNMHLPITHGSMMELMGSYSTNILENFGRGRVFDVPLLEPISDFSNLCVHLRNSCREALAAGIGIDFLSNWGRMDCDLLFRDRVTTDLWHIPNWACEVCHNHISEEIVFPLTCGRHLDAFHLCLRPPELLSPSVSTV